MDITSILIVGVPALLVGIGLGAAGYRRALKKDPEKLERLAKEIKARGERL